MNCVQILSGTTINNLIRKIQKKNYDLLFKCRNKKHRRSPVNVSKKKQALKAIFADSCSCCKFKIEFTIWTPPKNVLAVTFAVWGLILIMAVPKYDWLRVVIVTVKGAHTLYTVDE